MTAFFAFCIGVLGAELLFIIGCIVWLIYDCFFS